MIVRNLALFLWRGMRAVKSFNIIGGKIGQGLMTSCPMSP